MPQELERKGEAFATERRKATDTILDLQRRLAEAESTASRLTAEHSRLAQKLEAQRAAAEVRCLLGLGAGCAAGGGRGCALEGCCRELGGFGGGQQGERRGCRCPASHRSRPPPGGHSPQDASAKLRALREEAASRQEAYEKEVRRRWGRAGSRQEEVVVERAL